MDAAGRRNKILDVLGAGDMAVSASALARQLHVSRQIIVSDVALLRARDHNIISTPRGYMLNPGLSGGDICFKVACMHNGDAVRQELYTIVDNGGKVIDVTVEHPIYGQLTGQLGIASRFDADDFLGKLTDKKTGLLCLLTDGVHLHTVSCADAQTAERIREALLKSNILLT